MHLCEHLFTFAGSCLIADPNPGGLDSGRAQLGATDTRAHRQAAGLRAGELSLTMSLTVNLTSSEWISFIVTVALHNVEPNPILKLQIDSIEAFPVSLPSSIAAEYFS